MSGPGAARGGRGATERGRRLGPAGTAAFIGLLLAAWGCSPFDLSPPGSARVSLEGPAGRTIQVVTTTDFIPDVNAPPGSPEVEILTADTSFVTLPFTREYPVELRHQHYRFLIRASAVDEQSVQVRMRVNIAGIEWYNESWDLIERPHSFFYIR